MITRLYNVPDDEFHYHVDDEQFADEAIKRIDEKDEYIRKLESLLGEIQEDIGTAIMWNADISEAVDTFSLDEDIDKFTKNVSEFSGKIDKELEFAMNRLDDYF